jgi:hypothetical protein
MSELTSHFYYEDTVITPATHRYRVYHANEVDKVIAEKDAEIRKLNFNLWSARLEAAEAECDEARMARCRHMIDKFEEVSNDTRTESEDR